MKKGWEIIGKIVAILILVSFILCGVGLICVGVKADRKEQTTVEQTIEDRLIDATIVGIGSEHTTTLKSQILCQDRKGKYWTAEISGTPSKGQNVVLEIENEKVKTVWLKQVGSNPHLFLRGGARPQLRKNF